MKEIFRRLFLLVFAVSLSFVVKATEPTWENIDYRYFDEEQLEVYLQQSNYIYDDNIKVDEGFLARLQRWITEYIKDSFGDGLSAVSDIITYLLAGLAIFVIMYYALSIKNPEIFRRSSRSNQKIDHSILEELKEEDLEVLLTRAQGNNDYEMVVRIKYLLCLKSMASKKLIDWEAYKSNLEYYFEIENDDLKDKFSKVIDWFEYSWYGDFELNERLMKNANIDFSELMDLIEEM